MRMGKFVVYSGEGGFHTREILRAELAILWRFFSGVDWDMDGSCRMPRPSLAPMEELGILAPEPKGTGSLELSWDTS